MNRPVPDRARQLAAQLDLRFGDDARLAAVLNDAQLRLRRANDRLWSGLHPDGMAIVYPEHPAASTPRRRTTAPRSSGHRTRFERPSACTGPFSIRSSSIKQPRSVDDSSRDIGELAGELIATLVAAGWSEREAREANVLNLADAREPGHHGTAL